MRVAQAVVAVLMLAAGQQPLPHAEPAKVFTPSIDVDRKLATGLPHFIFNIAEGVRYGGAAESADPTSNAVEGALDKTPGTFTLIEYEGKRFARIHFAERSVDMLPSPTGGLAVNEIANADVPTRCAVGQPTKVASLIPVPMAMPTCSGMVQSPCASADRATADSATVARSVAACNTDPKPARNSNIDVAVFYTPAVESAYGGESGVMATTLLSLSETNFAFKNSRINARVRLASMSSWPWSRHRCVTRVNYAETGDIGADLDRLLYDGDGCLDEVRRAKHACHADIAVLLIKNNGQYQYSGKSCVMKNLSPAFGDYAQSVVLVESAVAHRTFTHEIGHLMGAGHEDGGTKTGMCDYSHAFKFAAGGGSFTTIMYSDSTGRIALFSDSGIGPNSVRSGNAAADNARTLRISAPTVADFSP